MTEVFEQLATGTRKESALAFVPIFVEQMRAQGYAPATVKTATRLVQHFVGWLDQRGVAAGDLSAALATEYLDARGICRCRRRGDVFALRSFCRIAAANGHKAPVETPLPVTPACQARQEFERYLQHERGLAQATVCLYGQAIGRFLGHVFGDREVRLGKLDATDVVRFVRLEAIRLHHSKRAKVMTSALRAYLRYGRYRGEINADLSACVPSVANWTQAGIPRTISSPQVECLLAACDRHTATGRRDYAILLLLARLGLRAGEVVELKLDDFDWDEASIRIHGPAQRCDRLPLPADVGAALVDYLRNARPPCPARNVFLRAKAPRRPLSGPSAVSCVVSRALRRADIDAPFNGAHLLRHSLATQMLGKGASLGEIAEILRHRNVQTTTIYAKVDLDALRKLALPWPGGAQ